MEDAFVMRTGKAKSANGTYPVLPTAIQDAVVALGQPTTNVLHA